MPEIVISQAEADAYLNQPVLQASGERGRLIPVVGAGLSRSIGLPSWQELAEAVTAAVPENGGRMRSAVAVLDSAYGSLARSHYEKLIQQHLDTPENKTSLAHQALVSAGVDQIITTNLDFALERAFELAGVPLRPENVIVGPARTRMRVRSGTILHKIHGSLEDPRSWVLRASEYESAYVHPGDTLKWWKQLEAPLLFIGFGFADDDIRQTLRVLEVERVVGSYAMLHIDQVRKQHEELKRCGIRPIGYLDVRQIPELIDEIFRSQPVQTIVSVDLFKETRQLRVGASITDLPITTEQGGMHEIGRTLANALDFGAPAETSTDKQSRRSFGERGQFISALQKWATNRETHENGQSRALGGATAAAEKSVAVIRGLLNYPDVIFTQLLPGVIANSKINARILTAIWEHADDWTKARIRRYAVGLLEKPFLEVPEKPLESAALRGIAIFVANAIKAHPAMRMPPITAEIASLPGLRVTRYPLTRSQVAQLNRVSVDHPIQPHTIHSLKEAQDILRELNEQYPLQGSWRIPTDAQWEEFFAPSGRKWPWGDSDPQRGMHAHLNYLGAGGPVASHPLEVGTYPGDIIGGGPLRDLVGNVYELVEKADGTGPALAGGGWTTAYKNSAAPTKISNFEPNHKGEDNIGLRVILVPR